MAERGLDAAVYDLRDMMGHMEFFGGFYALFVDISPGVVGLADYGALVTHLLDRRMIQEAVQSETVSNVFLVAWYS